MTLYHDVFERVCRYRGQASGQQVTTSNLNKHWQQQHG